LDAQLTSELVVSRVCEAAAFSESLLELAYISMNSDELLRSLTGSLYKIDYFSLVEKNESKYNYCVESFLIIFKFNNERFKDAVVSNLLFTTSQNIWHYTNRMILSLDAEDRSLLENASTYALVNFGSPFPILTEQGIEDLYKRVLIVNDGKRRQFITVALNFFDFLINLKLGNLALIVRPLTYCIHQYRNHREYDRRTLEQLRDMFMELHLILRIDRSFDDADPNVQLLRNMCLGYLINIQRL
jgi:hypothetical protein